MRALNSPMPSPKASAHRLPEHFTIRAIFVGRDDSDYRHLQGIFKMMNWRLTRVPDWQQALKRADASQTTHFLYEHVSGDNGSWIRALDAVKALPNTPSFILTSRLADERLWVDILNRGGYDLLLQPFDSIEVTRVVAAARRHSLHRNIMLSAMAG